MSTCESLLGKWLGSRWLRTGSLAAWCWRAEWACASQGGWLLGPLQRPLGLLRLISCWPAASTVTARWRAGCLVLVCWRGCEQGWVDAAAEDNS